MYHIVTHHLQASQPQQLPVQKVLTSHNLLIFPEHSFTAPRSTSVAAQRCNYQQASANYLRPGWHAEMSPADADHSTDTSFTAPNANSAATSAAATSASRVICALICEYGSCEPRRASAGGWAPNGLNTVYTTVPAQHVLSGLGLSTERSARTSLLNGLLPNKLRRASACMCPCHGRLSSMQAPRACLASDMYVELPNLTTGPRDLHADFELSDPLWQ